MRVLAERVRRWSARLGRPGTGVAGTIALLAVCALVSGPWAGMKKRLPPRAPTSRVHHGFANHAAGVDSRSERLRRVMESAPGRAAGDELGGPVSLEEEKLANRAIPGDSLPIEFSELAQKAAAAVASFHDDDETMPFPWQSIGPTNAAYPALLN